MLLARKYVFVTAILLLAILPRILHLDRDSLWIDEGTAYHNLQQPDLIQSLATGDHHPPLYYISLAGWMQLAGESVFSMRFFSVIPGILSIALIYPLARTLQREDRQRTLWIPLLAMLFLALADVEIALAQEVRMYTWRTLLVIASMLGYVRWLQSREQRWAAVWLVSNVALYHTQYMGLYVPVIQGLHALLFLRRRQRLWAIGLLAVSGLLFAPWFLTYGFDQRNNDTGLYAGMPSTLDSLEQLRDKFLTREWPLTGGLLLLGTILVAAGDHFRWRWRQPSWVFLLLVWLLFTVIVTYVGNFWYAILSPRRIMLITPALAILMAQGLVNIRGWSRIFLTGVIIAYGVVMVDDFYPKPPWDEVGADMARYAAPGQLALMEVYRGDFPLGYYVDQWMPPDTEVQSLRRLRVEYPDRFADEVRSLAAAHDTAWVAFWDPDETVFRLLEQANYQRTATLPTPHTNGEVINVYRYDRLDTASETVAYSNGMVLEQAKISANGERVELWWTATAQLSADYSVSVFLLDANGQLVAQHDSYPLENERPTTTWTAAELVYDPHPLNLDTLPTGEYRVGVKIYTWYDNQIRPTSAGDEWATIGVIER